MIGGTAMPAVSAIAASAVRSSRAALPFSARSTTGANLVHSAVE